MQCVSHYRNEGMDFQQHQVVEVIETLISIEWLMSKASTPKQVDAAAILMYEALNWCIMQVLGSYLLEKYQTETFEPILD